MSKKSEAARKAWMAEYSTLVTKACPENVGRGDWDMAHHFFYTHISPADAAAKTIEFLNAEKL